MNHLNFIKTSFVLMWKSMFEYKINAYFTILIAPFWFGLGYLGIFVMYELLGEFTSWAFVDFVFFFLLTDLIGVIATTLSYQNLFSYLVSGQMNESLIRPINPFIFFYFREIGSIFYIRLFISLLLNIAFVIYTWGTYEFSLIFFLIAFLILLMEITNITFLDSFNFFFKSQTILLNNSLGIKYYFLMRVPTDTLKLLKFKWIFYIFYPVFIGFVLINLSKELEVPYFWTLLTTLILIIIIQSSLTFINWKFGLKKYEAFG